jgi:hypothetical protein
VRLNRDTLYSEAVFDLDAGPVEITLADPGERFLSMMVIDEDQSPLRRVRRGRAGPLAGLRRSWEFSCWRGSRAAARQQTLGFRGATVWVRQGGVSDR